MTTVYSRRQIEQVIRPKQVIAAIKPTGTEVIADEDFFAAATVAAR
jgi:hypothetical protein